MGRAGGGMHYESAYGCAQGVGKKLGYGELAAAAAKLDVPKKEDVKFKPRSEWRYIGKGATSYDLKDMCTAKPHTGRIRTWKECCMRAWRTRRFSAAV